MCLVLVAYRTHPRYPLIIAANRDEYYRRPASPAGYWHDHSHILGGRDLEQGGTWLAVDRRGRLAAVTNYREPSQAKAGRRSRGFLVTDYLLGGESPAAYLSALVEHVREYDGFNLFAGDAAALFFFGSYLAQPIQLQPGIHGISNGDLDYPWPKVTKGKQALAAIVDRGVEIETGLLFDVLRDRSAPDDNMLPDTGVGISLERMLAPIFVTGGEYGTRSSTVLIIDQGNEVLFSERTFDAAGEQQGAVEFTFLIKEKI